MVNDVLDLFLKITPLIALGIAYMGLNTWKAQIKGTDKYKVASELLLQAYRIKQGIQIVRTPLIEYVPLSDKSNSEEMNKFIGYVEALERRWKAILEPSAEFSLTALKSEVHLGKEVRKASDELMQLVRELQIAHEMHIDMMRPGSGFEDDDFNIENRKVLFAKPTHDEYFAKVNKSISKLEKLCNPFL